MKLKLSNCLTILLTASALLANQTTINSSSEKNLTGKKSILDSLYGMNNLQRIDDFNTPVTDQYWAVIGDATSTSQKTVAKYAGFNFAFGVLTGSENNTSFSTNFSNLPQDQPFQLALDILSKPGYRWSSSISENKTMPNGYVFKDNAVIDHMVTYKITGNNNGFCRNIVDNYVVAWEDLTPDNLLGRFDGDYNDLVVEVSGVEPVNPAMVSVPEPPTIALLALSSFYLLKRDKLKKMRLFKA